MNTKYTASAIVASLLLGMPTIGGAAGKGDIGKIEYESNCILCHGANLKGGAYGEFLKATPPDLSLLRKNNGGVFPFERVYGVIDGQHEVKTHGPRDMPIWGKDYQIKPAEYYFDMNYDANAYIRGRILALIDYLNRMQSK